MKNKIRKMSCSSNYEEELSWESVGDELLFHKDKFEFTNKEKELIKKLLLKSPPPLQYRRKVRIIYFKKNIVMAYSFWSC